MVLLDVAVDVDARDGLADHRERDVFEPLEAHARLAHVELLAGGAPGLLEPSAQSSWPYTLSRYSDMCCFCDARAASISGCPL
ncbi:MAG: hypothetical protein IPK74_39250 [Deltaproteobacteria bacterium]|nr:hypothetical protein [Deltaproteobacteria bacterium]